MTVATLDYTPTAGARHSVSVPEWVRVWILDTPEVAILAGALLVGYLVAAWIFRYWFGYFVGDALARTSKAVFMAASRDPHFGAVGFYWPPLPSTLQIPFVLALKPFGRMDFAGPISSALCSSLAVLALSRIGREAGLGRPANLAVCVLFGANPVVFVYAINGMSEACAFLCLLLVLMAWLRWTSGRRVTDLAIMGVAAGALVMTRIETLPIAAVLGLLAGAGRDLRLGLMRAAVVALPPVFAVVVWIGTQGLLTGDPLDFLHQSAGGTPTYSPAFRYANGLPTAGGYLPAAEWAARIALVLGPVLVAVAVVGVWRRRTCLYPALGLLLTAAVFPMVQIYLVAHQTGFGDFRYFTPIVVVEAVSVCWLAGVAVGGSRGVGAPRRGLHVAVVAGSLTVLLGGATADVVYMLSERHTHVGKENQVLKVLLGRRVPRGDSLSDARALMAVLDPHLAKGERVIADSGATASFPFLVSRHPSGFIVQEDRDFQSILSNPDGRFSFIIVANSSPGGAEASPMTALLSPAARWHQVAVFGDATLYQYSGPVGSGG